MLIEYVTVTGADDSTNINDIIKISNDYPHVEWGILMSKSYIDSGCTRFPSMEWIKEFRQAVLENNLNASAHFCGDIVRGILFGEREVLDFEYLFFPYNRFQINTHAQRHPLAPEFFALFLHPMFDRTIIFQMDGVNDEIFQAVNTLEFDTVPLFDMSSGAGVLPDQWPEPIEGVMCGYAGGLSPENTETELVKIDNVVGPQSIWIDAETRLRSQNDQALNFDKVKRYLDAAEKYVSREN